MNPYRRFRNLSLVVGAVVLGCVLALVWWFLRDADRVRQQPASPAAQDAVPATRRNVEAVTLPTVDPVLAQPGGQDPAGTRVRGVVELPDGRPAAVATVVLYRQVSAWPEWRREEIDTAITGANGRFEFPVERAPNLLVGFGHQDFAGGLQEAPPSLQELVLRLERGFDVQGIVTNDGGLPMGNVRVALESTLADFRMVRTTETTAGGRFRFPNVAMGAMRVVARHDIWQPAVLSNVVVGADRSMLDLRFSLPALSLEGRVVAAATQEPIADAVVRALPPGQDFGQNDPATASTDADGRFRLAGLSRGILRVEVRHRDFGTAVRTFVVGPQPTPLAVDLPPRSTVRGRLAAADPALVRGAHLTLRSSVDELASAVVGDDGTFAFERSLTPGWASLSVADGQCVFATGTSAQQVRIEENGTVLEFEVSAPAVVTGRIVDQGGAPIAGARLSASQADLVWQRLRRAGNALLDFHLTKFGDQLTRSTGGEPEPLLAVTGRDGRFRIAGLPPGPVDLRVVRPGYGNHKFSVEVPACGEVMAAEPVQLPRGCRVRGQVRRGGRPLPGAQVGVVALGLGITAVTGLDGRYELQDLPPGQYTVRARFSTFPIQLGPDTAVTPERPAEIDLEFPPGRTVRGVVRGLDEQPVEGALVLVRGEQGNPVSTDSNGAFVLEAPSRAVELQIGLGDDTGVRVVPVPLGTDEVEVAIDAPPNCTISGSVVCLPGRRTASGVLLRISRGDGDDSRVTARWIELQAGRLRHPLFPAGRSRVTFWCEGQAPVVRELDLAAGEEHALGELLFEPGATLRGRVVDEAGAPVAGAEVFLGEECDLQVYQSQNHTAADGAFSVRGVSSAAASLVVRSPGYAARVVPLRLPQDVLGAEPLQVRLERGSTIRVEVGGDGAAGVMLVLRRGGRVLSTAETDEDGTAVFANCGPGDYVVQRFDDERQQAAVRVERSGEEIAVDL
ncbi:MAG: carboxypeptidase regulatory-like domain-containing protein [Planctomycetota bacterium]